MLDGIPEGLPPEEVERPQKLQIRLTDASLVAICDTLGKIGTGESVKVLTRFEKPQKGSLVPKIREAIKKIEDRLQK